MPGAHPVRTALALATVVAALVAPEPARAQLDDTEAFLAHVSNTYRVVPNVTYHTASGHESRLDVYTPRDAPGPVPVVLYFHGGGWVAGDKESNVLRLLPYLEMGWAAVNVEYRLGEVARAPAAVVDGLCALRWVVSNADEYGFDTSRVVTTGNSAGGHLALTTGMVPEASGLGRECPGDGELEVAAIINWYGITDVGDLLDGADRRSYAVEWLGSQPDRFEIADRVSPMTYVRSGLPPVLSIHGDADPAVPYQQAVRLHEELDRAGVDNVLHTVPGGSHGGFDRPETLAIFRTIHGFLDRHDLGPEGSASRDD